MASDILSYNVVQDHEGISIKGYRGLVAYAGRHIMSTSHI